MRDKVQTTKTTFANDLKSLHTNVSKFFSFIIKNSNDEAIKTPCKNIYSFFKTNSVEVRRASIQLTDYFTELETLKNALVSTKNVATELSDKVKAAEANCKIAQNETKNVKENLERKTKRCNKLKQTVADYRNDTLKLVTIVERELEVMKKMKPEELPGHIDNVGKAVRRQSSRLIEVPDLESPDQSPLKIQRSPQKDLDFVGGAGTCMTPDRREREKRNPNFSPERQMVWFDFDKSQKRFDDMLDGYKSIIEEKDNYIKEMDQKLVEAKKERLE